MFNLNFCFARQNENTIGYVFCSKFSYECDWEIDFLFIYMNINLELRTLICEYLHIQRAKKI